MFARRWGFVSERMLKMNLSSKTKAHLDFIQQDEMHFYPPAGDVQGPDAAVVSDETGTSSFLYHCFFSFSCFLELLVLHGSRLSCWMLEKFSCGSSHHQSKSGGGGVCVCLWESMVSSRLHSSVFTKTQWLLTEVLKYCRNTQLHPEQQTHLLNEVIHPLVLLHSSHLHCALCDHSSKQLLQPSTEKWGFSHFSVKNYRNNPKNLQFHTLNLKREALKESLLLYKSNTWIGFFNYHRSRCTDVWQIHKRVPVMTTENRKCKKTTAREKKTITTAQKHNKHKGKYIRKYNNSNNNTNKSIVRPSL